MTVHHASTRRPFRLASLLPPLAERLAEGRPVITREQANALTKQIMTMSSSTNVTVYIEHRVQRVTRLAHDAVQTTDNGDTLSIALITRVGDAVNGHVFETNQLDEPTLRALVARADAIARESSPGVAEQLHVRTWNTQDAYRPVQLWHPSTVTAMHTAQETAVPAILDTVRRAQLRASGFVGLVARASAVLTTDGVTAFHEETDSEIAVTARPSDGTTSGWSGQAARDWSTIDPVRVATEAADIARRNQNPRALEPGRRTAILGPAAVVQIMRFLALHFSADQSTIGNTGFSKVPRQQKGARFNQRVFDSRVHITSDPADRDGGFVPWGGWDGMANPPMSWIEQGVLKNLAYSVTDAMYHGKSYAELPFGLRMDGGPMTVEQMIAQCEEGIYVHRLSSVDVVDMPSGMLTGATRDGCFFIKHGKIDRPVKNFRFLESPFFMLNNLMALGPTQRAAFGYASPTERELDISGKWRSFFDWPRWPMIVPPMMVRDFNFSALIDAV